VPPKQLHTNQLPCHPHNFKEFKLVSLFVSTKISINIEITNKKSIYNKIVLMRVIKLTESDLIRLVKKVILTEQTDEAENDSNTLLALRNFSKGKITTNDLYGMDDTIEDIRVRNPLGQSLITIKLGEKEKFLEEIGLSPDDAWFRDVIMSSYGNGFEFTDTYTIEQDFTEGYIFEFELNEENTQTLKGIAGRLIPGEEVNLEDEEYRQKLHGILLDIFPRELDYILSDYSMEKDNEMNQVAKESIKAEFDDKLDEMGVDLSYDMDEVTITLADLFSEALQLNLFNSSAQEMVIKIISNKLGSHIGGWYENNYEYRDSDKFDEESFNRTVENQFEKILEKMDEDSESEYTVKDYIEFRTRVLNKFKIKTWYETPKDKDIIFAIQDFDPTKMTVQLTVKDRGTQLLKDIVMDEENFTQFLHQPSLFKLDDMY
jgi:hypothetical protein